MKISKINIKDFHQFNGFNLDLTYPKGHEKEGLPLEKVCIIGQSGTGKTTLLNLILEFAKKLKTISMHFEPANRIANNQKIDYSINQEKSDRINIALNFIINNIGIQLSKGKNGSEKKWDISINESNVAAKEVKSSEAFLREVNKSMEHFIISYPADINVRHQFVKNKTPNESYKDRKVIDFSDQSLKPIWSQVYKEIVDFQNKEANFRIDLTKRAEVENINIKEEIANWRKGSQNPLINLADKCFNPIIENFGLKVETDLPAIQDINVIRTKNTVNNKIVPFEKLSSGTKQIILTALPLYELNTLNSVILVDEPEVSLYPDIQRMVIELYTSLAQDAQFFYATHSPIIASLFEPWEIVELKFDYEKGQVYREEYYDVSGQRHIDNYFINPQYLRWDSILTKVFDLKERGNDKRIEKMMELVSLGKRIEKQKDKADKAEIYQEYKKLASLLDWEIQ